MNNFKSTFFSPSSSMFSKNRFSLSRWLIMLSLTLMIVMAAVPGYWGKSWSWQEAPKVSAYQRLLKMRSTGLSIADWPTTLQKEIRLDNVKWSIQVVQQNEDLPVVVMLLPQGVEREKPHVMWSRPYVEWTGIDGIERWKHDRIKTLTFETASNHRVKARFFKAWNQQTFAVIQWYAWPGGGGTHSFDWFWRDQLAQLSGQRVPWVAVNIKIPTDPLSDLEEQKALAQSIAPKVQTALEKEIFQIE